MAVQRQTAASRLTSPLRSEQHLVVAGVPILTPLIMLRTSAHTPNLSASVGQLPLLLLLPPPLLPPPDGVGQPLPQALVKVKKRRLKVRRRAIEAADLVAIGMVLELGFYKCLMFWSRECLCCWCFEGLQNGVFIGALTDIMFDSGSTGRVGYISTGLFKTSNIYSS